MNKEMVKPLGQKVMEIPYWYHKIELPDDVVTPGWSPIDASKYGIPDDLTGKRVLDIGAWDGYWTWEALKRGASEVVAIDDFSDNLGSLTKEQRPQWETFDLCREAFGFTECFFDESLSETGFKNETGQKCFRMQLSAYEVEQLGKFDVIFFFGTLYHLKHPLKALQIISDICDGEIYLESAICDDYSPYRGGMGKGYPGNDMVMEFYPENQYGNNENNWWVPTLQCLGNMVRSVGFDNIHAWGLSDKPKGVPECRGFVYGSKKDVCENIKKLSINENARKPLSVAAVMSVPRLGFMDNQFCVFESVVPHKIPIIKMQGAFWGQCLERGIQQQIDDTNADAILTIDYDTIFSPDDVGNLIRIMTEHPEVDALVPIQVGRNGMQALLSMKSKTGKLREFVPNTEFEPEITKVTTGHFGMTLIRTEALLKMPHPWFWGQPGPDGQWHTGRVDDDIYFWQQAEKAGLNVYSANRIVLGHLELVITWPTEELKAAYQITKDYQEKGKPTNIWR